MIHHAPFIPHHSLFTTRLQRAIHSGIHSTPNGETSWYLATWFITATASRWTSLLWEMFPYHHVHVVSFCSFFQSASWSTSKPVALDLKKNVCRKDIRTSLTNLNHFPLMIILFSHGILEHLNIFIDISLKQKSSNMLPHFFHHVFKKHPLHHLHRFIFQLIGIPRSVFPILRSKMGCYAVFRRESLEHFFW